MAEYINRNSLIANLDKFAPEQFTRLIRMLIENHPAERVSEVKYGHWVQNEKNIPKMKEFHKRGIGLSMANNSIFWTCSECGMWGTPHSKYCGECGAYMRGDK